MDAKESGIHDFPSPRLAQVDTPSARQVRARVGGHDTEGDGQGRAVRGTGSGSEWRRSAGWRPAVLLACLMTVAAGCHQFRPKTEVVHATAQADRDRAARLTEKGRREFEHGKLEQALNTFQSAILADDSYGPAHNNLGIVYFDLGDLYSAAWSFEQAKQLMPERPEPFNNLGEVLEAAGRGEEAIVQYGLAHQLQPDNPEYLGNLVRARRIRGDADPSVAQQLQQLAFIETRPDWRAWVEDQLALYLPNDVRRLSSDSGADSLNEVIATPPPSSAEPEITPPAAPPGPTSFGPPPLPSHQGAPTPPPPKQPVTAHVH